MPFVTLNSCSTYKNTNAWVITNRQAMINTLRTYQIIPELVQDLHQLVIKLAEKTLYSWHHLYNMVDGRK
jgi:hypothetical protein